MSREILDAFIAAREAISEEQSRIEALRPGPTEPAITDRAKALLRLGGIERVIDSGECPGCALKLFDRRSEVAAHNRRIAAFAATKQPYDAAMDAAQKACRSLRLELEAAPDAEKQALLDELRAELGFFAKDINGEWL